MNKEWMRVEAGVDMTGGAGGLAAHMKKMAEAARRA